MRIIEKYGSGIWRISDFFKKDGLPAPKFENIAEGFQVTVYSEDYEGFKNRADTKVTEKVTEKVTRKVTEKVTENQELIIKNITVNPNITSEELSKIIGITPEKIRVNLSKLKAKGLIERVGSNKGGYWKVIIR
jgi:ATP-dependent DNA helicase RecG